jgi:hypothetical protein
MFVKKIIPIILLFSSIMVFGQEMYTFSMNYIISGSPECSFYNAFSFQVYANESFHFDPESLSVPEGSIVSIYWSIPTIPTPPVSLPEFSHFEGDTEPSPLPGPTIEPGTMVGEHVLDILMDSDKHIDAYFNINNSYCSQGNTPPPTLPPVRLGDVNEDNIINIIDALLTAQYYVKLNPHGFLIYSADVNCDDKIDIIDALLISQYYVKLINEFCVDGE